MAYHVGTELGGSDATFPADVGKDSRGTTCLPRIGWGEALVRRVSFRDISSEVFVNVGLLDEDNVDMIGVGLGEGNSIGF